MESIPPPADIPQKLDSVGWREWVALPRLDLPRIKAKVDTGARTSALHAFDLDYCEENSHLMVCFKVHPLHKDNSQVLTAKAPVLEKRHIRNSGGQAEERPVIQTLLALGKYQWSVELTLTNRDMMGFRMLIGREAVRRRFLVDPGKSYLMSSDGHAMDTTDDETDESDLI